MNVMLIQDLFEHQAWADAALVRALAGCEAAAADAELLALSHHVVTAHRFYVCACRGVPFSREEQKVPESWQAVADLCRINHEDEKSWLAELRLEDLEREVELPGSRLGRIRVFEALLQVCMHSQGHRAQIASALRKLGGKPPVLDYVLWAKERCGPEWM